MNLKWYILCLIEYVALNLLFYISQYLHDKQRKVSGVIMLSNKVKFLRVVAAAGLIGTTLVSQAGAVCAKPDPSAIDWACVDVYLTPSTKLIDLDSVSFKINSSPSAYYTSDNSLNEASVLTKFLLGVSSEPSVPPTTTPSVFLLYGLNGQSFTPSINPLFRTSYFFTQEMYPSFTNDLASFGVSRINSLDTIFVNASDISIKTQYVINNGAVTIDNGFPLDLTIAGVGTGIVTSTPAGIICSSGICRYPFSIGTPVALTAAPTNGSCLTTISCPGGTINSNTCNVSLYDPTVTNSVSATFSPSNAAVKKSTTLESSSADSQFCALQEALDTATTGSSVLSREGSISADIVLNRSNTSLVMKGSYANYAAASTGFTTISGSLTIQQGTLTVDKVAVF